MICKYSEKCPDYNHYLYPCSGAQKAPAIQFCWRFKKYRRVEGMLSVNKCREINACVHLKSKELNEGVFDGRIQLCSITGLQPRFMFECPLEAQ